MASFLGRHWKVLLLALLILGAGTVTTLGIRSARGLSRLNEVSESAKSLQPAIQDLVEGRPADVAALRTTANKMGANLSRARRELVPVLQLSAHVGWVPKTGPRLRNARAAIDTGEALTLALEDFLAALDLVGRTTSEGSTRVLEGNRINEDVLMAVSSGEPLVRSALNRLATARRSIDELDAEAMSADMRSLIVTIRELAPRLESLGHTWLTAGDLWRPFLGYEGPRTYLIVAQNADELRAVGGFIPGAWLITLDHGEITQLRFWDTTEVDDFSVSRPLPPEPLIETIWAGVWLFADSSWYPDFPTSAQSIRQIFAAARGVQVDGVIGLNQWALEGIFEALDTLTLPDGTRLNGANYMGLLEQQTDAFGRAYIDNVLLSFMDRLRAHRSTDQYLPLLLGLHKSLRENQILLNFDDAELQGFASANGWDGALSQSPGDFLMVVDSNVGFSKVNRNVEQALAYHVQLQADRGARARLDIQYTNKGERLIEDGCALQSTDRLGPSYELLKNACYWDYLRVYLPEGSSFEASTPLPMPGGALYRRIGYNDIEDTFRAYHENGKQVFAGFFNLDASASRTIAFSYALPAGTVKYAGPEEGKGGAEPAGNGLVYSLQVAKQPGKRNVPLQVVVEAPPGYVIKRTTPPAQSPDSLTARFDLGLDEDISVQVTFEAA